MAEGWTIEETEDGPRFLLPVGIGKLTATELFELLQTAPKVGKVLAGQDNYSVTPWSAWLVTPDGRRYLTCAGFDEADARRHVHQHAVDEGWVTLDG